MRDEEEAREHETLFQKYSNDRKLHCVSISSMYVWKRELNYEHVISFLTMLHAIFALWAKFH